LFPIRASPSQMKEYTVALNAVVCDMKKQVPIDRQEFFKKMDALKKTHSKLTQKQEMLKCECEELEKEVTKLTTANETQMIEFTKKQEFVNEEKERLLELQQIVEQKEKEIKHFTERNQQLSDQLYKQQQNVKLQELLRLKL